MIRWISLLLLSSLAAQPQNLDATQREAIARKIHALVQQYFAHWEGAPRPAVETAFKTYLDNAMRAGTRQDFDLATLRFVATLRNGHTQFSDNQADGRPPKFRLVQAEGQWAVGFSQDKNLPQGSVVRTINGRPVDDFIRDSALYVAASNERLARTHVFSYPMLFPEQITLGLQSGANDVHFINENVYSNVAYCLQRTSYPPLAIRIADVERRIGQLLERQTV